MKYVRRIEEQERRYEKKSKGGRLLEDYESEDY